MVGGRGGPLKLQEICEIYRKQHQTRCLSSEERTKTSALSETGEVVRRLNERDFPPRALSCTTSLLLRASANYNIP
jgi:hypothetical protein